MRDVMTTDGIGSGATPSGGPLVSVVVPCHNYGRFLGQAIGGVLAQTYRPIEVLVIDDASTDDSAEVARGFGERIVYHRGKWGAPAGARNFGIRQARGEFIALLDADDRWLPGKLEVQMGVFAREPGVGLVHGGWRMFRSEDDGTIMVFTPPEWAGVHEVIGACPIGCSTAVFRKTLFEEVGGFDEGLRGPEDWDLWIRMAGKMGVRGVKEVVGEYRVHGKSLSRQHERQLRDSVRVLRKYRGLHGRGCPRCAEAFRVAERRVKNMYYAQACAEAKELWGRGRRLSAVGIRGKALWNYPAAVARPVKKVGGWLGLAAASVG